MKTTTKTKELLEELLGMVELLERHGEKTWLRVRREQLQAEITELGEEAA